VVCANPRLTPFASVDGSASARVAGSAKRERIDPPVILRAVTT